MKKVLTFSKFTFILIASLVFVQCSKDPNDASRDGLFDEFASNSLGTFSPNGSANQYASGEGYNEIEENPWVFVEEEPISTFSVDADGASYSNVRRFLNDNKLPPVDAVRTEELINYFPFDYPQPEGEDPMSLNGEISDCPWSPGNKLLRIGLQGVEIPKNELPKSNFVFLIDVSGSMGSANKLDLLKESFILFTDYLQPEDKIAIVTYAGHSSVVLPSTAGSDTDAIVAGIQSLGAGGGTAGAQGILTAYEIAEQNFIPGGNNRVILGTDGDFNIGISNQDELVELIEEKRETGIFLTVLGVGSGNLQDGKMEQIANNGNGTYEYIDHIEQGEKVFIREFGKFYTVAKDVKVQIKFNPNLVSAYRLIGYENRLLETPDFEDDEIDAAEIGAGQSITAIYELKPTLLAQSTSAPVNIDFRYKKPDGDQSVLIDLDVEDDGNTFANASESQRFAASVAGYGMMLRDSPYKGNVTWNDLIEWASNANTFDPYNYRQEFIELVEIAKGL